MKNKKILSEEELEKKRIAYNEYMREYRKEYLSNPENKKKFVASTKKYRSKEEVKEKLKAYHKQWRDARKPPKEENE